MPPSATEEDDRDDGRAKLRRLRQLPRMIALLRPYRWRFVVGTVALLLGSGLGLLYPQAARLAVDTGITERSLARLNEVLWLLVLVFVAHAALVWIRHYLMSWLGERVVTDLRGMVFDSVLTLPAAWFHERRSGELVGRLAADVTAIESVVGSQLSIALRNGVQLIGGVVLLFVVDTRLTLYMLMVVPPLIVGTLVFGRIIRKMAKAVQDRLAEASGHVQESIGAITTVQAFTRERREAARYREGVEGAFVQAVSLARWRASFFSAVSTAGYLAIALILYLGGRAVIRGDVSAGDLTAFLMYTLMVATSLGAIAGLWSALQRAGGATERLFGIIDTVPEIAEPDHAEPLPDRGGSIRFDRVSFAYASRPGHAVLRDVSLAIEPGEVVALVGPSGAGKSTLTALVLRLYDVGEGAVYFEGVDVRRLRLRDLRGSMAIVSQEPVLFSGSLRDNIAYARPGATDAEVQAAAREAHCDEFIARFPDGYDTVVGERGVKLSGGQRQRVAIARALLKDPRVLILDEATSSLDAGSEALVQEGLARLMQDRTTLVIAHRLSTVRDADRIILLDGGCIVEEGTHDQLMRAHGIYRRLVEHQVIVA